ncbi:MAG: hypothetical protein HRU15_13275 [Planctomycetes bacterium]|nr:hypothetical protein [Planctomycetota bacterium]
MRDIRTLIDDLLRDITAAEDPQCPPHVADQLSIQSRSKMIKNMAKPDAVFSQAARTAIMAYGIPQLLPT